MPYHTPLGLAGLQPVAGDRAPSDAFIFPVGLLASSGSPHCFPNTALPANSLPISPVPVTGLGGWPLATFLQRAFLQCGG